MDFGAFLQNGWGRHGQDPKGVFAGLSGGLELSTVPGHLTLLANLAAHLAGEHLGEWEAGAALIRKIAEHALCASASEEARVLAGEIAWLHYCAGNREAAERLLSECVQPGAHADSGRICMLAKASSALAGREQTTETVVAFEEALDLASYDPQADDPAARALAISGNNVAWHLLEQGARDAQQTALMTRAAATARKYWERVGNWINVKIAEVTQSRAHLSAGEAGVAADHARNALEVCDANDAPNNERFFPYIALARAQHALDDRAGARETLARSEAALESMDPGMRAHGERDLTLCRSELGL